MQDKVIPASVQSMSDEKLNINWEGIVLTMRELQKEFDGLQDVAREMVRQNPTVAVASALALGAAVGWLVRVSK